jgi:hypothetical protein
MPGNGELAKLRSDVARMELDRRATPLRVARPDHRSGRFEQSRPERGSGRRRLRHGPLGLGARPIHRLSAPEEPVLVRAIARHRRCHPQPSSRNAIGHAHREAEVTVSVLPEKRGRGRSGAPVFRRRIGIGYSSASGAVSGPSGGGPVWSCYRHGRLWGAHGGRISVDVGTNGGSVFTLYFPPWTVVAALSS